MGLGIMPWLREVYDIKKYTEFKMSDLPEHLQLRGEIIKCEDRGYIACTKRVNQEHRKGKSCPTVKVYQIVKLPNHACFRDIENVNDNK